jgi:hypothetical protein
MFSRPRSRPVGIRRGNYRYSASITSISRSQGNPRLRWRHVAEQHGKRPVWHLKRPLFAWLTKCRGCGARLDTRNPKLLLPRGSYSSFTQTLLAGRWIDFALRLDRLLYLGKSSAFTGGAFYFCYFSFACLHEFHFPKLGLGMLMMRAIEVGAAGLIVAFGGLLLVGYMASEQLWMFTG